MHVTDHSISDFEQNAKVNQRLIELLDRGLTAFNQAAYPDPSAAPVVLSIQDREGVTIAGLLGRTAYGWMRVDVIWVDDRHRGKGYGAALLSKAEEIAIDRGCYGAHLDTHGFQAPRFYERLGYEAFGELENYPAEHKHVFYRKAFVSAL